MKLMTRDAFLKMPAGTLFATYTDQSGMGGDLGVKLENQGEGSFLYQSIKYAMITADGEVGLTAEAALQGGETVQMDYESPVRDRNHQLQDDIRYAVWDKTDRRALIKLLQQYARLDEIAVNSRLDCVLFDTDIKAKAPVCINCGAGPDQDCQMDDIKMRKYVRHQSTKIAVMSTGTPAQQALVERVLKMMQRFT